MSSLRFGAEVLQPVSPAAPGRTPLRRRASAPGLVDMNTVYGNAEDFYQVGNCIRIQLQGDQGSRTVTAKITKSFAPFSMATVLVVHIFEPTIDLEGEFVLKVYDIRYSDEFRSQHKIERWSQTRDMKVEQRRWSKPLVRFFHAIMADDWLYYTGPDDDEDEDDGNTDDEAEQDEDDAREEVFLRAHGIDGVDVPRFISNVRIPPSYQSKNCPFESSSIKGAPGVLIQYVQGFPLLALCDQEVEPVPRSHWKHIIDDGVRIVYYTTTEMDFSNTDCCPRNTVVHWDPIQQDWKCKLIDFGHCMIRREGTSDWDWRDTQAWNSEEDCIGMHMMGLLEKRRGFEYVWERSQYCDQLAKDFRSDP
ncbi:hypothetical protein OPT61_g10300 [Boeremia exigua]|uniref:Uncharacterized protein n=1 Tax=Boeremia exigua TaxID=749465 RepID=A0ACC2HQC3_9PLEO|nr:hypothetical protein OPT61_g10300 [Boeremia exigua]